MSVNVMKEQTQERQTPRLTLGHLRTRLVEWGAFNLMIPSFWNEFLIAVQKNLPTEKRFPGISDGNGISGLETITSDIQLKAIIVQLDSKNNLIPRIKKNIWELWLGNIE